MDNKEVLSVEAWRKLFWVSLAVVWS
jgi:hypothetical protein